MLKIKKGDQVVVISGRDKGKKGEVIKNFKLLGKVVVKGINVVKKTIKKSKENPHGGFIEVETPIHVSNLMLFCPKCGKGTRVGVSIEKKSKFRICKKCGNKFE